MQLINHFNSYNNLTKIVEKSSVDFDELSIERDCKAIVGNARISVEALNKV